MDVAYRDRKFVGVFVRFRAPLSDKVKIRFFYIYKNNLSPNDDFSIYFQSRKYKTGNKRTFVSG
jgi:hypothetical protein